MTQTTAWIRTAGRLALCLSGLLAVVVAPAYALRPDPLSALTMWPAWAWVGLGLALAGAPIPRRRAAVLLWAVWGAIAVGTVDEGRALLHPGAWQVLPHAEARQPHTLRVVSLNCAGGDPAAAAEVARWHPDIVLLQEAPREPEVRALAQQIFGSQDAAVVRLDTAVLARGLTPIPLDRRNAAARVPLPTGTRLLVASVRLNPTLLRIDLWNPQCWSAFADDRRARRAELQALCDGLPSDTEPWLLGGDLNAPAGDGALAPLWERGLRDAFGDAGAGWGDTIGNELPIHRIDQIWSRGLAPRSVIAVRTIHSDHRMVVAEFALP